MVGTSSSRQALRRTLHLSIDPNPWSFDSSSSPDQSSLSSVQSHSTPSTAGDNWRIYSVLCIYDFKSNDPDHLSFHKNEILDVVKQEESGWWAALRRNNVGHVGWIPKSYVQPLSDAMAERLRNVREELRFFEYNAERMYDEAPVDDFNHLIASSDTDGSVEEWPVPPESQGPAMQINTPSELITRQERLDKSGRTASPQSLPRNAMHDGYFTDTDFSPSPDVPSTSKQRYRAPPSPSTPMPRPPHPFSAAAGALRSASLRSSHSMSKSTSSSAIKRMHSTPPSDPSPSESPGLSTRKLAESIRHSAPQAANRIFRRRHAPLDDRQSQSSIASSPLSTLLELSSSANASPRTSSSIKETDEEVMDGTADGVFLEGGTRPSRRTDKIKQLLGDEDAQRFHNAKMAQANLPWYLRPSYADAEIKLDYDGSVKAGTLSALVERLTIEPLKLSQDTEFQNAFLATFKTFATADQVFDLLVACYEMDHPAKLTDEEFEEWKEKKHRPTQARVLNVLMRWLEDHALLDEDPHISARLRDFLGLIVAPEQMAAMAKSLIQILDRLTFATPESHSPASSMHQTPGKRRKGKSYKSGCEVHRMDPTEIAQHLTLLEHRLFCKIRPSEMLAWARSRTDDEVKNLDSFCAMHDKLAAWVKSSILETEVLTKRADTVDFWVKVAEKCKSYNNLSSLSAIVTAVSSTVITQLHLTWVHVNRSSHLEPLIKLNEPTGSFAAYRSILQSIGDSPCVPFIPMYLSDIVHIGDQYPDTIEVPPEPENDRPGYILINFTKRQKWHEVVSFTLRFQAKPYAFPSSMAEDPLLTAMIETNLAKSAAKDHNSFWQKSQEVQELELAHADIRKGLEAAGF